MSAALAPLRPLARIGEGRYDAGEVIAVEQAVAFEVNGLAQAVMMASPSDLEDFALGFARAEGWIHDRRDLLDIEPREAHSGLVLALQVTAACEHRLKLRRRLLAGRTGCGVCGIERLDELEAVTPDPLTPSPFDTRLIPAAMQSLAPAQVLNARCGGLHGAAWCDAQGRLQIVREDIGRHNALDKLAGALMRADIDASPGLLLVSSRASHELIHKAALSGCGVLASVSAPSSLAVSQARRLGLQLWAFVREGRATRYA